MPKIKRAIDILREKKDTNLAIALMHRYVKNGVGTKSAAMAYYLVFSLFPLLIVLGNILGRLNINVHTLARVLKPLMPAETIHLLVSYIDYVNSTYSTVLLTFATVFSIYFPWRAVKGLMEDVREAYDLGRRVNVLSALWRELACTFLVPVSLFLSLISVIMGENVIKFFLSFIPDGTLEISDFLLDLWQYLRFALAALMMGFAVSILYEMSLDRFVSFKRVLPGVVSAILIWITTCIGFSFYVENFANYTIIYGTLGAFIILLLWFYWTSLIFIMGGEINAAVDKRRKIKQSLEKNRTVL